MIPMTYCPNGNIVNFSYTSWIRFFFKDTFENAIQTYGEKNPQNLPSLCQMWTSSNTPIPWPTSLTTPNGNLIASCTFTQVCHKVPNCYNGMPTLTPKIFPSPSAIFTPSNTPSLNRPYSPPQTASRSNQPFSTIHPPHRLTNRRSRPQTCKNTNLWSMYWQRATQLTTNNTEQSGLIYHNCMNIKATTKTVKSLFDV